jgi:putative CocE/NonD family hydrolase
MAGIGAARPSGRCRRPAGRDFTCTRTGAWLRRRRQDQARSTIPSIRAIRRRRWAARSAPGSGHVCRRLRPGRRRPALRCLGVHDAPLEHQLEIIGPITVRLWIASDAPDTDFTSKLIDVYPPTADYPHGFAMNLTEGLLPVRYRDSREWPALMVPGEIYAITVELFPVANLFGRGHRLRLDSSSSNFPHFDVNPNSGEPEGEWQQPRIAHNRVFADAARPSNILLPFIPGDEVA